MVGGPVTRIPGIPGGEAAFDVVAEAFYPGAAETGPAARVGTVERVAQVRGTFEAAMRAAERGCVHRRVDSSV